LKAMFETSAEVLGGLIKAFDDYEKKNEAARRNRPVKQRAVACSGEMPLFWHRSICTIGFR
jgi:hypothetical protein